MVPRMTKHIAYLLVVISSVARAEPPAPAAELAAYGKAVAGAWTCTGKVSGDGKTMLDARATATNTIDLDRWWIATSFHATFAGFTYEQTAFTSFVAPEAKFRRVIVDNVGGSEVASAPHVERRGTSWRLDWIGEAHAGIAMPTGRNVYATRHHETMATPDAYHRWGEVSLDGKTWIVGYDVTCTR